MATTLLKSAYSAFYGRALQVLRDQLEILERSPAPGAGPLKRPLQTVADVVVDQGLLGAFDGALHGLQLLRDLGARPVPFEHFNDGIEMAVGPLQSPGARGMRM